MPVSDYPPAESIVQVDNPTARVTAWRFTHGSSTGHHRHAYDYVVVPLSTGRLLIRSADGEASGELLAGQAYFRQSGVEHEVINDNDFEIAFVEIELKRGAHGS
jgi:quercetin dioxygenase-like cupin family protein